jgi:hypothetical protein
MPTSRNELEKQLNGATVKHQEELYWLKLKLDTTAKAKEEVEDRMAELYRDMQVLQVQHRPQPRPVALSADYVSGIHSQLDKYERLFRIMNRQMSLARSSCDKAVQTIKEELSDLMEEKCRVEMELLNKLADMDKENRELKQQQKIESSSTSIATSSRQHSRGQPPNSTTAVYATPTNNSPHSDSNNDRLQEEVERLRLENSRLSADALRTRLSKNQMDSQKDQPIQREKEGTLQTLDRVSLLWDRANESIHNLESVMMELRPNNNAQPHDHCEQLLSTVETASLVHGQVKVSLMLIELKLRNDLACFQNDHMHAAMVSPNNNNVLQNDTRIEEIQTQAMAAIREIELVVDRQVHELGEQSAREAQVVQETLESKVHHLSIMQSRQQELEVEIANIQLCSDPGDSIPNNTADLQVSRKVLEQLQKEVLQVVERVKEKNTEIGRLTAILEEHKIRERSLMEELRRLMKEQGELQMLEQQRLIAQARLEDSDVEDSCEYEEETVDEETFETVYGET